MEKKAAGLAAECDRLWLYHPSHLVRREDTHGHGHGRRVGRLVEALSPYLE